MVVWCTQNVCKHSSSFTWHQPCNNQQWHKYTTWMDIQKCAIKGPVIYSEAHSTRVQWVCWEWRIALYIKVINNNFCFTLNVAHRSSERPSKLIRLPSLLVTVYGCNFMWQGIKTTRFKTYLSTRGWTFTNGSCKDHGEETEGLWSRWVWWGGGGGVGSPASRYAFKWEYSDCVPDVRRHVCVCVWGGGGGGGGWGFPCK